MNLVIISGGQTGVDRGALDAALRLGIPCGGWCPAGRRAEDGRIDSRYPLRELNSADYSARTRQNVSAAEGTLIISPRPLVGGTLLTRRFAEVLRKPLLIVPPRGLFLTELIEQWLKAHRIHTLNVAGPRESSWPGIQKMADALLTELLQKPSPAAERKGEYPIPDPEPTDQDT